MAFVIFALPRSRTTWLSKFLSYGDYFCGHDEVIKMRQIEDVQSWFAQPMTGTVETSASAFWRLALHLQPDLKFVVIRRDPVEAAESAFKAGFGANLDVLIKIFKYLDHKLGQIERRTGCLSIKYENLRDEVTCKTLFEHVLPYKHDTEWWNRLDKTNIQTNPIPLIRYMTNNWVQIDRLKSIAHQKELSNLATKLVIEPDALTLSFEPLAKVFPDMKFAMQEHCAAIGEHPGDFRSKNIPLFLAYEEAGALQVTVARSNGRVFGYLITILGESFEEVGKLTGCHTVFYASPDYPGLGLKLQRKAIEGLRERGVHEVVMRAGVRGSGERIASLYKRIGAEPVGAFYRLQIGEV